MTKQNKHTYETTDAQTKKKKKKKKKKNYWCWSVKNHSDKKSQGLNSDLKPENRIQIHETHYIDYGPTSLNST